MPFILLNSERERSKMLGLYSIGISGWEEDLAVMLRISIGMFKVNSCKQANV